MSTFLSKKKILRLVYLVLLVESRTRAFLLHPILTRTTTTTTTTRTASAQLRRSSSRLWSSVIPVLDQWQVMPNGSIIGTVKNHPSIQDGDVITTSPIADPQAAKPQIVVQTATGSQYRLLTPLKQPSNANTNNVNSNNNVNYSVNNGGASSFLPSSSFSFTSRDSLWPQQQQNQQQQQSQQQSDDSYPKLRWGPAWNQAVTAYRLSQLFIGLEEEYLLAGKPIKSTSGKSTIWDAYLADEATGGLPKIGEPPVCVKVSTNLDAVSREYENYRKLGFLGTARGRFVKCHEFFPVAGYDKKFRNQCALVLEKGSQDLKTHLTNRGRLEGKELRDACMAAAQCVQALHTVGLVWTDLKTENFVVMANGDVKGIDLESAMAVGDNPVDYSPEACPPEFAASFLEGQGPYFILDTSYDVWSLGMLMLELSTGEGFFDGKSPAQITKWLRDCDSGIPLDYVTNVDDRLKDLLRRCLQKDPKRRPNMAQVLLHPYFITSPFSIFQNFA